MGRPLGFDPCSAIGAALGVFWSKGFEGATLTDLTEAMGITRPSLYAKFGDKEALFHKALEHYDQQYMGFFDAALSDPSVMGAIGLIVAGFVDLNASDKHPRGSPDTVGTLVCSSAADSVRCWLLARRQRRQLALAARFERAVAEGEWPADTPADALATYLMTLLHGMDVQAASGASRAQLEEIAALGLRTMPPVSR